MHAEWGIPQMPRLSEGRVALGVLALFAFWLLVVLPLLYHAPTHASPTEVEEGIEFWHILGYKLSITDTLIAVFTLGLFLATFALWYATRNLVKGAEQTAARQLQAYLSIPKARIADVEPGNRPTAKLSIVNSGHTPAYNLSAELAIEYGGFPIPKGAKMTPPPSPEALSQVTLGPGMRVRHRVTYEHFLTSADLSNIANQQAAIYVVGKIRYTDAFKRGWAYRFRLMFTWRGLQSGSRRLEVCEEGNEVTLESGPILT